MLIISPSLNIRRIITILFCITLLTFLVLAGYLAIKNTKDTNIYIQCCGGVMCTDTYYTPKDNLCHLSLCENSLNPFFNKSQCTYKGANVSINLTA